jgi:hypothetical protein
MQQRPGLPSVNLLMMNGNAGRSPSSEIKNITIPDARQGTQKRRGQDEIPVFISKTFEIFSNKSFGDYCCWNDMGTAIIIKKVGDFSNVVLPHYFKHSNFNSFVRQLNM